MPSAPAPPPPPPPPPPALQQPFSSGGHAGSREPQTRLEQPVVPAHGPPGSFLVELFVYNGHPFKHHWAYFVRSSHGPGRGVKIHATGDVNHGFTLEFKRGYDLGHTDDQQPTTRIPLQYIDGRNVDERAMFNNGVSKIDDAPVCRFESSAYKIKAPEKSLHSAGTKAAPKTRVMQRDCQTWIVESANQLVADGIFTRDVADYLHVLKQ
ncbi:hypothetical protein JDV02_007202 [Purpureocillium takamizusanense]|uniref:Uncharacterized protein n=1 Tax=Purpureocillium takamizusanense TaxID=2060973 RepID=A0A9Q8QL87_9HYPO|nr:uncharacterized protein JDV02_007202 [Purpureocillium takamizusanense]UNI21191.1 hypothetical protein JDV02_007202 [Purpureocillium takamizusanense]